VVAVPEPNKPLVVVAGWVVAGVDDANKPPLAAGAGEYPKRPPEAVGWAAGVADAPKRPPVVAG